MSKKYRLIDALILPLVSNNKGIYQSILNEFLQSGKDSVMVEVDGKNPKTVCNSLKTALRSLNANTDTYKAIAAIYRTDKTYLARKGVKK